MRYVEIEQKFQLHDIDLLVKRLTRLSGAAPATSRQVDTYFNAPHRDFLEPEAISEWLRLREDEDGHAWLNYKRWLPVEALIKSHCDEYESLITDAEAVRRTLEALDFTPIVVVDKRRQEWHLGGETPVTVAIDTLERLGTFVEFEYAGQASSVEAALAQLDQFVAALEVPLGDRIHRGYPHLLLGRDH